MVALTGSDGLQAGRDSRAHASFQSGGVPADCPAAHPPPSNWLIMSAPHM
jgi:hypothetical protein